MRSSIRFRLISSEGLRASKTSCSVISRIEKSLSSVSRPCDVRYMALRRRSLTPGCRAIQPRSSSSSINATTADESIPIWRPISAWEMPGLSSMIASALSAPERSLYSVAASLKRRDRWFWIRRRRNPTKLLRRPSPGASISTGFGTTRGAPLKAEPLRTLGVDHPAASPAFPARHGACHDLTMGLPPPQQPMLPQGKARQAAAVQRDQA